MASAGGNTFVVIDDLLCFFGSVSQVAWSAIINPTLQNHYLYIYEPRTRVYLTDVGGYVCSEDGSKILCDSTGEKITADMIVDGQVVYVSQVRPTLDTYTGKRYQLVSRSAPQHTLIDGTAYNITGGKCLVGGTAYSIIGGKTLIGGTAYDISV